MKVERKEITIGDLYDGFVDGGENGIVAYGERLSVRPPYQREFCYNQAQQEAVMRSVINHFPINVMYWMSNATDEDGNPLPPDKVTYELLDGQQRTLSICRFLDGVYAIDMDGKEVYAHNLTKEERRDLLSYRLDVYVCDGTDEERLKWFEVINTAGEKLTPQELRNATYAGPWVTDAKRIFSKTGCYAVNMGDRYIKGNSIRQEILERVLGWAADADGVTGKDKDDQIKKYMAKHQHDKNARELKKYFTEMMEWVEETFPDYHKEMKGLDWGRIYNTYHKRTYDADTLRRQVNDLYGDSDVTRKGGIFEFVLQGGRDGGGSEKLLSIRSFDETTKHACYKKQDGKCAICGKPFKYGEMHGDHIVPWSKGGHTTMDNCQMLCRDCNLKKSGE